MGINNSQALLNKKKRKSLSRKKRKRNKICITVSPIMASKYSAKRREELREIEKELMKNMN